MKRSSLLIVLFLSLIINSCNQSNSEKKNTVRKEVDGVVVEITSIDTELILKRETNNKKMTTEEVEVRRSEIDQLDYYMLNVFPLEDSKSILQYGVTDKSEYLDRLDYFSFKMKNDIFYDCKKQENNPVLYVFERSFEISKFSKSMLAFEKCIDKSKRIKFDGTYLGLGILFFNF